MKITKNFNNALYDEIQKTIKLHFGDTKIVKLDSDEDLEVEDLVDAVFNDVIDFLVVNQEIDDLQQEDEQEELEEDLESDVILVNEEDIDLFKNKSVQFQTINKDENFDEED